DLRRGGVDVHVVDEGDVAPDRRALGARGDGFDALQLTQHLVARHPRAEAGAALLRVAWKVQIPPAEQVGSSRDMAATRPHDLPRSVIPQMRPPRPRATPTAAPAQSSGKGVGDASAFWSGRRRGRTSGHETMGATYQRFRKGQR